MRVAIPDLRKATFYRVHILFAGAYLLFNVSFNIKLDTEASPVAVLLYSLLVLLIIYVLTGVYYVITLPKVWPWGLLLLVACYVLLAKYAHLILYEVLPNFGHEALQRVKRGMDEFLLMNAPRFFYYSWLALFFVFHYRDVRNIERNARIEKEDAEVKERAARAELARVEAEKKELLAAEKAREMELQSWNGYTNTHFLQNELEVQAAELVYATSRERREALANRLKRIAQISDYNNQNVAKNRRTVVFEREWQQLLNYLELRDLGRESCLQPVVEQIGVPMGHKLVPMTLVYLAEGAFKHGDLLSEPLHIRIGLHHDRLDIRFRNRLPRSPKHVDTLGSGLTVVKRRLELAMPGKFTWEAGAKGSHFEVYISIDQTC